MLKKRLMLAVALLVVTFTASFAFAQTVPKDEKKLTTAGKYVNALEAYEMWKANPGKVKIIDVRTPEEYSFIGHAPMAFNIPIKLWNGKFDAEKKEYGLDDNPEFEAQVKKVAAPEDTVIVMCRSGHRSAPAVNRLTAAGFTNAYNLIDGFEGDKISDDDSYSKGKRMKNGWKNSSLAWTTDLDAKLVFTSGK